MKPPISRFFLMTVCLSIGSFLDPIPSGASGKGSIQNAVFYSVPNGGLFELRLYHPDSDTIMIASSEAEPSNIFWYQNFSAMYYRVENTVFKLDWKSGAFPESVLNLPEGTSKAGTLWIDDKTRKWRFYEVLWPQSEAAVYEYIKKKGRWKTLAQEKTHGCEKNGSGRCGQEVREFTKRQKDVQTIHEISHQMKIWNHLSRFNIMINNKNANLPYFFPSIGHPNVVIESIVTLEDSLHGTAPIYWIDRLQGTKLEIYGESTAPGCSRLARFLEQGRWLLTASESEGQCGRVVDMTTGKIVTTLPEHSHDAVWVPLMR